MGLLDEDLINTFRENLKNLEHRSLKRENAKQNDGFHNCFCPLLEDISYGTTIRLVTDSGDIIEGELKDLNSKTCVVKIMTYELMSPPQPSEAVYLDCRKIESVAIVL